MENQIFIPTLSHWEYGNEWSGERGRARYLITPADGQMNVEMWLGPMARAFVEPEITASFPICQEGIDEMKRWLLDSAARLNAKAGY